MLRLVCACIVVTAFSLAFGQIYTELKKFFRKRLKE